MATIFITGEKEVMQEAKYYSPKQDALQFQFLELKMSIMANFELKFHLFNNPGKTS